MYDLLVIPGARQRSKGEQGYLAVAWGCETIRLHICIWLKPNLVQSQMYLQFT